MPEYDFECRNCKQQFSEFYMMDECPEYLPCIVCGERAPKIISFQGGLKTEHPTWINQHLRDVLQKDGEKPITTRSEHDAYLKENGIVQRS